jgi:hypothetical protein
MDRQKRHDYLFYLFCVPVTFVSLAIVKWLWPGISLHDAKGIGRLIAPGIVICVALLGTLRLGFYHRRERQWLLSGCCRKCGYDLQAHKRGERCPECGTLIMSKHEDIHQL